MKKIKFENFVKGNSKYGKGGKGFYIALAVCIIAVGAAAWSTYGSVMNYMNPKTKASPLTSASDAPADRIISGITGSNGTASSTSKQPMSDTSSSQPSLSTDEGKTDSSENSVTETSVTQHSQNNSKDTSEDGTVETVNTLEPEPESDGALIYPVGKNVLKKYSGENPVFSKTFNDWRVHRGVDFAADKGSPVKAMTGGVVKEIYTDDLMGVTVVIEHNGGFVAYYSGLGETTMVRPGDGVGAGDIIGAIKGIPSEQLDDFHLHLEIKKADKFVDPLELLTQEN